VLKNRRELAGNFYVYNGMAGSIISIERSNSAILLQLAGRMFCADYKRPFQKQQAKVEAR
jgi:hypothetical protein